MRNTLYPDDVFTSSTGEQSVGLLKGKYTSGTVSPYVPPSRVPSSQFNLLNDLLGEMILGARLTPNNTDTRQLVKALRHMNRYMEWQPDVSYEFGDMVVARLFEGVGMERAYKCQQNNTGVDPRTCDSTYWMNEGLPTGTLLHLPYITAASTHGCRPLDGASIADIPEYTRLRQVLGRDTIPDMRGRVARACGGDAPAVLQTQEDAMQQITGGMMTVSDNVNEYAGFKNTSGAFYSASPNTVRVSTSGTTKTFDRELYIDSARQTRTANETRVKSMGWHVCIVI